ncbi:imidazoleglycerol-phosphate dehydratase HisB [Methanorbis rubei]|uniref:Imidazoleglycerol-phosphate dehydratase n=1 Tax=Methanorbis rubei TaxID=3028300 RepID=A0AAE4MFA3_9EURY|nr:Histidine biosynthesis bifunctional protein HisB [Methanocorpusculaceae archaeon Cs1]
MTRRAEFSRVTKETAIDLMFDPDVSGEIMIDTGLAFLDHMLNAFARHGGFSLKVSAKGDLAVDAHHTIEDIGIVLGTAISQSVGEGRGIKRFSHAIIPMDESRATAAIDVSGRGYLVMDGAFTGISTGGIPNDLFEHFLYSLCMNARITAHVIFSGVNDHHKCEAIFKAFGVALGESLAVVPGRDDVPSTKGTL